MIRMKEVLIFLFLPFLKKEGIGDYFLNLYSYENIAYKGGVVMHSREHFKYPFKLPDMGYS
ncbi:MAG: hypothetical protein N2169_08095, partial [bacterium]|nr:hypothetical protein [bacterium]